VLAWWPPSPPYLVKSRPPKSERRRHRRKYAEGDLGPDKSFIFTGPDSRLRLRAQNLLIFLQMADGVDDATWGYHLRRHDYSRWLRDAIKDPDLAAEVEHVEKTSELTPDRSRALVREKIEKRYTHPD
jgi:hypothetical protein